MSPFRVVLWPIIKVLKLTCLMPLTTKNVFSVSRSTQYVSAMLIVMFIAFGSVRTFKFIFLRDNATQPVLCIRILGIILTILSAVSAINCLVFKAEKISTLLNNLETIFNDLRNVNITNVLIRVWVQFFILHFGPLLYTIGQVLKFYTKCSTEECLFGLFVSICNISKSNCLESALVFFLSIGQIITECYKSLLKDLE